MSQYKDMVIPDELDDIIAYMRDVDSYREELSMLGHTWDLLTILGQMTGGGTDMTTTREAFKTLTEQMIANLGHQTLEKTVQDMTAKAQVTVDLIIRNLFERTADIGFLATDDDIRDFLRSRENNQQAISKLDFPESSVEINNKNGTAVIARFQEYVAKYSVYHNIILLDTDGNVVAQLDQNNPVKFSSDPLLAESIQTQNDYVETFRHSDLLPDEDESLIYSYRVTENNQPGSPVLGVLCLCFRFDNEMEGIFRNLSSDDDWSVLTLLDKQGKVISSNSPHQIPVGTEMEMVLDQKYKIVKFSGRRYLAKTVATHGYQDFYGLGWYGHAMLPLDVAFESTGSQSIKSIDEKILNSVLNNQELFSKEIQEIPINAEKIQSDLDRTVWNGNIATKERVDNNSNIASKVLLWEISNTGLKTKKVFERSIENLHETVVSTYLSDVEFLASLSINIMDRNLYERANDCRWWALTSEFRRILGKDIISQKEAQRITDILAYINGLYTVYTNLFVYDKSGKVIAVSNPSEQHLVGTTLKESWVSETAILKNSQSYSVSPFDKTALYSGEHSYIYNASIKDLKDTRHVIGGIGIVFDSEPEFKAMLMDSLPRDHQGELINGCFGVFTDNEGIVISSTSELINPGEKLPVDASLFTLKKGESSAKIVELNGYYYAVGIKSSNGYREFKGQDDNYKNEVFGFIFMELDKIDTNHQASSQTSATKVRSSNTHLMPSEEYVEIASFYIGNKWYGIKAENVIEAIAFSRVSVIPGLTDTVLGSLFFNGKPILIFNPGEILGAHPDMDSSNLQVVIFKTATSTVGIVVDSLGEIPKIENTRLGKEANPFVDSDRFIEGLVELGSKQEGSSMLIILNPDELGNRSAVDSAVSEEIEALELSNMRKAS